jgi:hypothetical protein
MARRRRPTTTDRRPRVRPELRPAPPVEVAPDPAPARREREQPPTGAGSGTAVGILLGFGVLLGGMAAYLTGQNLLIGCGVGGVVGAIAGIVLDRRAIARRARP